MTLVGLVARNLARNKLRSGMTIAAVAVAVMGFVLLRAAVGAWTKGAEAALDDRVVTRNKFTLAMPLPRRYADDVARVPHVRVATHGTWLAGRDARHPDDFFATVAIDHATYFDVFDEAIVAPEERAAFFADRRGAMVGDVLARRFGWKIGDRVTLESGLLPDGEPGAWTFTIRGVYASRGQSMDRTTMLVRWDYVNDVLPSWRRDRIGWVLSRIDDPKRSAEVSLAIDRVFEASDTATLSQDESTFRTSMLGFASSILRGLDAVSAAILVLLVLLIGNTIAMGARERVPENAVMRAIGFRPWHVAIFIVGEGVLVGALGGALGVASANAVVAAGLGRWFEENTRSFFPHFSVSPALGGVAMLAAIVLAAVAAALPARSAARLRVVDALRRVA